MKNLIKRLWGKTKLPLLIIIFCAGTWGWTAFAFIFPPMYQEAETVWTEHLQRQVIEKKEVGEKVGDTVVASSAIPYAPISEGDVVNPASPTIGDNKIEQIIYAYFKDDYKTAKAVAFAESKYDTKARHLNSDGSTDCGLWEINSVHNPTKEQCDDPEENTKLARKIYESRGNTFNAWCAYTNKSYLAYF